MHIVVATPGRLCELLLEEDLAAFQDLSSLRFLVVDEADRIVEEGHFAEVQYRQTYLCLLLHLVHCIYQLHRVFSRIRDHEKKAEKGEPGVHESGWDDAQEPEGPPAEDDSDDIDFPPMPTEEEIARARAGGEEEQDGDGGGLDSESEQRIGSPPAYRPVRQTLLFSATAIQTLEQRERAGAGIQGWKASRKVQARATKLNGTLKGVGNNSSLPVQLKGSSISKMKFRPSQLISHLLKGYFRWLAFNQRYMLSTLLLVE